MNGLMKTNYITPDFVFEASWEVCNKVGGIYTVLSTHAKTLQEKVCPNLIFVGPDFGEANPLFDEDATLFADWVRTAQAEGLKVRTGWWTMTPPKHPRPKAIRTWWTRPRTPWTPSTAI